MKEILKEYIDKEIEVDGSEGILKEVSDCYFVVDMFFETYNEDNSLCCLYTKYIPYRSILEILIEKRAFFFYDEKDNEKILKDNILIIRLIKNSLEPTKPSIVESDIFKLSIQKTFVVPEFFKE